MSVKLAHNVLHLNVLFLKGPTLLFKILASIVSSPGSCHNVKEMFMYQRCLKKQPVKIAH